MLLKEDTLGGSNTKLGLDRIKEEEDFDAIDTLSGAANSIEAKD